MSFKDEMQATLKPGFVMPESFLRLFDWIERNDQIGAYGERVRFGTLAPLSLLESSEPVFEDGEEIGDKRGGGSSLLFVTDGNEGIHHWFGEEEDGPKTKRLSVFAKTGSEGSMAAFWVDDDGHQHIVHIGSGSGSTLTCVFANSPIDFIRLTAIGYDELCWDEAYDTPPNTDWEENGIFVEPYKPYQN